MTEEEKEAARELQIEELINRQMQANMTYLNLDTESIY